METVLRDACDNCHRRKSRCSSQGSGACASCRSGGHVCIFSPRNQMGRPRIGRQCRRNRNQMSTATQAPDVGVTNTGSGMDKTAWVHMMSGSVPQYEVAAATMTVNGDGDSRQREDSGDQGTATRVGGSDELASLSASWNGSLGTPLTTYISLFGQPQMPLNEVYPATYPSLDQFSPTYKHHTQRALESSFTNRSPEKLTQDKDRPEQQNSDSGQGTMKCHFANSYNMNSAEITRSRPFEPESLPEWTDTSLIEIYGQLSQLLFALHGARDTFPHGRHNGDSKDRRAIEGIFSLVSSLCNVVEWLRKSASSAPKDSISPCMLLGIFVVSTVVEIYHGALNGFKDVWLPEDVSALMQARSSSSSGIPSPLASKDTGLALLRRPPYHAHMRLRILSDAIAMDFHLGQLKGIFTHTHLDSSCGQMQLRLEQVRKGLQALIEDLRNPI